MLWDRRSISIFLSFEGDFCQGAFVPLVVCAETNLDLVARHNLVVLVAVAVAVAVIADAAAAAAAVDAVAGAAGAVVAVPTAGAAGAAVADAAAGAAVALPNAAAAGAVAAGPVVVVAVPTAAAVNAVLMQALLSACAACLLFAGFPSHQQPVGVVGLHLTYLKTYLKNLCCLDGCYKIHSSLVQLDDRTFYT